MEDGADELGRNVVVGFKVVGLGVGLEVPSTSKVLCIRTSSGVFIIVTLQTVADIVVSLTVKPLYSVSFILPKTCETLKLTVTNVDELTSPFKVYFWDAQSPKKIRASSSLLETH